MTDRSLPLSPTMPPAAVPDSRAGFLPHVHHLRGLALIFVVGAHCWPGFAWNALERRELAIAFDNVTVVFMFVSGLLFQHLSGRFDYARYLRHRAATVLLPYVIVSVPAIVAVIWFVHRPDVAPWVYDLPAWRQAGYFLLTGKHLAPLWFMPMIALFILAAPVFIAIDRRDLAPALLPATLAVAVLLGRDSIGGAAAVLGKALFMLPAYLAGMAYARHRRQVEAWATRRRAWLVAGVVIASLAILTGPGPLDISIVQKLMAAVLLLSLLRAVTLPVALAAALSAIATRAFAIYFVHGYVITSFRLAYAQAAGLSPGQLATGVLFPTTVLGLVADIALVTLVSLAIVECARRLLGRSSRWIVGA